MTSLIQSDRPWIGGSSVAAVLCLPNPGNRTPLTECLRLWGRAPELDAEDRDRLEGRKALEPYMAHKLARKGILPTAMNQRYFHPEYPWLAAEIDFETADSNREMKTRDPTVERFKPEYGQDGEEDGYGVDKAAQLQWGLLIRPKPMGYIDACIGFDVFRSFPCKPNAGIQQMMFERVLDFMMNFVLAGVMPAAVTLEDARQAWPTSVRRSVLASSAMVKGLERMGELDRQIKALAQEAEKFKLQVVTELGDADTALLDNGKEAATYKTQQRAGFTVKETSFRVLRNMLKA